MNTINRWTQKSSCLMAIAVIGLVSWTQNGFGQYIFFDRFDSESVGAFPSTWTNVSVGPSAQVYVTNNIPSTPSTPNAFKIANLNSAEVLQTWRQFPQYSLNTVSQLVVNFSLNVSVIPSDGSGGFVIVPGNQPVQGEETFSAMRVLGNGTTWSILNPYYGSNGGANGVTNGLALNTWYNFRFEIDPSPTNAQKGVVRWYMNNTLINTESTFTVPSLSRTNINSFIARETFPGSTPHPITTFYLDNVYLFTEVPEPSALTLGATGAALIALRMQRSRKRH